MGKKKSNLLGDFIPDDVRMHIEKEGLDDALNDLVYRVAKYGVGNEDSFMSTFEEIQAGYINVEYDPNDIGVYSTSVFLDLRPCQKFLKFLKKKYFENDPRPCLVVGSVSNGLWQKTKDRNPLYKDENHVDWWIYRSKTLEAMQRFSTWEE